MALAAFQWPAYFQKSARGIPNWRIIEASTLGVI